MKQRDLPADASVVERITFITDPTIEERVDAVTRPSRGKLWRMTAYRVLTALVLVLFGLDEDIFKVQVFFYAGAAGLMVNACLGWWGWRRRVRRDLRNEPDGGATTVTLDERGLHLSNAAGTTDRTWPAVSHFTRTRRPAHLLTLYRGRSVLVVVPERCCASFEQVCNFVEKRVGITRHTSPGFAVQVAEADVVATSVKQAA